MKHLVSVPPEKVEAGTEDQWVTGAEVVVPWYLPVANVFLAIPSFKKAPIAEVIDRPINVDDLHTALKAEYPGLPDKLHENYLLMTIIAIQGFSEGTRFRIFIDANTVRLQEVGNSETLLTLWTQQPLK